MANWMPKWAFVCILGLFGGIAFGAENRVIVETEARVITPGKRFPLKILVEAEEGWQVKVRGVEASEGFRVEGEAPDVWLVAPEGIERAVVDVKVDWVGCNEDSCVPGSNVVRLDLPVAREAVGGGLGWALLLAFGGGMILNLMPCVLPVVSLKILSFVNMAGGNRLSVMGHGAAFTGGVLASFWALAGVLLGLRSVGQMVGWGFQLQEPVFVALLILVLFGVGLSLVGVFELGTSMGGIVNRKKGLMGSFMGGVLATVVATPCTGPLLAPALGFAMTVGPSMAMLLFSLVGLGMSTPYLALSLFPSLLERMPKPGAWMITFKQITGFFMFATVLWLLWVFVSQVSSPIALVGLGAAMLLVAIAGWVYGKWFQRRAKWTAYVLTIFAAMTGVYAARGRGASPEAAVDQNVMPWSLAKLQELRSRGVPVFVDFTAKWCLICQMNKAALHSAEVQEAFAKKGVVYMQADWTKQDGEIAAELEKFGRSGVPLYLFYGQEEEPKILPQILTAQNILDSL